MVRNYEIINPKAVNYVCICVGPTIPKSSPNRRARPVRIRQSCPTHRTQLFKSVGTHSPSAGFGIKL